MTIGEKVGRVNKKGKGVSQTLTFATRIDKELGEQFRQKVAESGQTVSDLIEKLIIVWMYKR